MSLWGREEADREVPARSEQDTGVGKSFDDLARSIAGDTMPRRRALRLFGGALVGAAMASIPGLAWARGKPCPQGTHLCTDGSCVPNGSLCPSGGCPTGQVRCGAICTDLQIDPLNCGTCGNACTQGQSCVNGVCVSPTCPDAVIQTSESCMSAECSGCAPGSICFTLVRCLGPFVNCGVCCPEGQLPCYIQQPDGSNLFTQCCPTIGGEFGCDRATGTCL